MAISTVDSPGKKLHDKRLQKQMSVADAARLTHIRPDRIIDLEKDDYSNFPSLAYARGFLLIYARLLEVDVSQVATRLENSNPVDIDEYEYLSGKSAPLTRSLGAGRRVFAALVGLLFFFFIICFVAWHIINSHNRLDETTTAQQKDHQLLQSGPVPAPMPVMTPLPVQSPTVPHAEAVTTPAAAPAASAAPVEAGVNEVVLHPLKKTWVKIQQDDAASTPIYDDWLYPDAHGLTLHGRKFWIEIKINGDAVQITKNGKAVPYSSPGIIVQ